MLLSVSSYGDEVTVLTPGVTDNVDKQSCLNHWHLLTARNCLCGKHLDELLRLTRLGAIRWAPLQQKWEAVWGREFLLGGGRDGAGEAEERAAEKPARWKEPAPGSGG